VRLYLLWLGTLALLSLIVTSFASAPSAGSLFEDVTAGTGIRFRVEPSKTSEKYLLESMAGGVGLIDYDDDGRLDIYFVNGAKLQAPMKDTDSPDKREEKFWNRLYRNNGDGKFTDVTKTAGVQGHSYGMGVTVADYDNDGRSDLYVTNLGRNILYRNNGDGTFGDVSEKAGVAGSGWSTSAAFVDYDADGYLDLIVVRYLDWAFSKNLWCGEKRPEARAYCHPNQFQPVTHLLYHNSGDGTFSEVSEAAGWRKSPGKGLGVALNDFDRDGRIDVLIANDSFPQQLFQNKGKGTFEEVGLTSGLAYDEDGETFAGMGVDFADYDNDGWPDVFINALANQKYALFKNAKGVFDYVSGPTNIANVSRTHSGWGTRFLDYDNDGWKDIFVGQGHVMDNIELTQPNVRYLEPLLLMRNVKGKFEDVSGQAGEPFRTPRGARGAAIGDLDNDGGLDIVINCIDQPAVVLRNTAASRQHWLTVNTIGKSSNRDGIGAKLRLVSGSGSDQHAIVSAAGSYLASNDKRAHFGIGTDRTVKMLEITWPSGIVQRLENLAVDQIITAREPAKP
jgi:enediyne biosynthesis protein E4